MRRALLVILLCTLSSCGGADGSGACTEATSSAGDEAPVEASPPAEVRALADAERRASPPGTATIVLLARGNNAFVARLEMEPGAAVPEHQDADEEYIHVLEGEGTIWIDGAELAVAPGSTIFMPADSTVRFQNGGTRMVALQVFAGPASAAKYDRWRPLE